MLLPCNHKLTTLGAKDDRIDENCVADLDKQIEWLGAINFLIYHNQETFREEEYGALKVDRHAELANIQTDQFRPNWIDARIQKNSLGD